MDDSQLSTDSINNLKTELMVVKQEIGNEDSPIQPHHLVMAGFEREIQMLERDIRHQKESSVNAKTAITFEQLKQIHIMGKVLGPQKEIFYDRICRAADIQRASLKNRLKQNKEKFEPPTVRSPSLESPSIDSQTYLTPPTLQSIMCLPNNDFLKPLDINLVPPSTPTKQEEEIRLPAERILDLMQLGFSFDEVKQMTDLFDQYKDIMKPHSPTLQQVLSQFSNFISTNIPDQLKLISSAFNLLEMGYSRKEVAKSLAREGTCQVQRERPELDEYDRPLKMSRTQRNTLDREDRDDAEYDALTESSNGNQQENAPTSDEQT